MALNCTYTYNGNQYTESELKDLFLSGEISKFVINKSVTLSDFLFLDPKNSTPSIQEISATIKNKKDMISALQTVFSLPKDQAEVVAKIYDAAAQGMVNLGIYLSKEEYYNNTPLFIKPEQAPDSSDVLYSEDQVNKLRSEKEEVRQKNSKKLFKAPNGKPTNLTEEQWLTVRTPTFKEWFGDWEKGQGSKVLDENGEPKVMFHGTKVKWTEFDINHATRKLGLFLSSEPEFAEDYASSDDLLMEFFVKAQKVFDYENKEDLAKLKDYNSVLYSNLLGLPAEEGMLLMEDANWQLLEDDRIQKFLRDNNYDGYYVKEQGIKNIAVYDSTQVKVSDGRNQTFLQDNPNILFQYNSNQVVGFVEKGFELQRSSKGFGMSFVTKTGSATPELAVRINKWLSDNGYTNVQFRYERTYGTLQPFYREEKNLFNQNAKGAIDLNKRIIYALTSPDVTTPLHEFAHLWLSDIENAAMNGNIQANGIMAVLQNFAESDEGKLFFQKNFPNQEFNAEDSKYRQELFARGFERYIADGQAPKSILEKIFDMFKKWLNDIYNGITGSEIDIQLNNQMQSVYDQILGKKAKPVKNSKKESAIEKTELDPEIISEQPIVTEEVKINTNEEVTPLEPIQTLKVKFEEPVIFSKKEVAIQNKTATLTPFETEVQESNGIKTNDKVIFKNKEFYVKSIDSEGFLTIVDASLITERNGSLFYNKPLTRGDIDVALPQMVKVVEAKETVEDAHKFDPVFRIVGRLKELFPQIQFEIGLYKWEQAGRFQNGKVLINKRTLTKDTPIHEFLHPFIYSIRLTNPQLYNNLITDLQSEEGKNVVREIVNDKTYSSSTKEEILDEAIVRLMSRDIVDVFDEDGNINEEKLDQKRKSFSDSLKELFIYLMDLIFGRKKNTNVKNFISLMNSSSDLKDKFLFKSGSIGTSRSKIETLSLNNKTVIYINPKYFTPTTIVDNLFYDIQQDLSEEDYNLILKTASNKIRLTNSSNKRNPISDIKYTKSTNTVIIRRFSELTGKHQQSKAFEIESFDDLAQYMTPDEFEYVVDELNKSVEDKVTISQINQNIIGVKDTSYLMSLKIQDIPVNLTISELADFLIIQNVPVEYNQGELEAIGNLTAYSSKARKSVPASAEVKSAIAKLQSRIRNLKDTGDRRIKSVIKDKGTSVTREANALEQLLKNQDEVEALLEYIRHGVVSLEFAVNNMNSLRSEFYEKINDGTITPENVNEFNRRFKEISTYFSYYSDLSYLTNRFEPLFYETQYKSEAKEELKNITDILAKVEYSKKNFQNLVTDMVTEWLYPHYYNQMTIIADRNKNLPTVIQKKIEGVPYIKYGKGEVSIDQEVLKKHLRNQLVRADEDSSFVTHLLGSTITSRDPINAISSMVITDAIYDNDEYVDRLWVVLNRQYELFLKEKNLPDSEKTLREWYKNNYLRQALSYEKTGRNEDGTVKYEYVPRWAYNEDKFYDFIDRDLREFAKSLPLAKSAEEYTANKDLLDKKRKQLEADPKYINPRYNELLSDGYYMMLYKNHQYANNFFGTNGLRFGIIGQVNTKKSPSQAVKETISSAKEKLSDLKNTDTIRGKVKNVVKSTTDYLFDKEEGIDNLEYNFDESLYRNIRTSTVTPIQNEEDLELLLHENVMVFSKDALKYSSLRNIQANIDNLKYLVQGNPSLGINPRKVISLDKSGNKKWFNFIKLPKHKEQYQNRLNDQLVKQINDVVYGDSEEEAFVRFGQSRDEKGNLVGGVNISLNKVGSNLGFGTALLNMAGNLLSMTRNITIGNVTNLMEAVGSRYVSKADYGFALAEYGKQIFNADNGILADAFSRKKSKIAQMALLYDAIQGEYRDREGRIISENFTRRYYSKSSWFLLNHAAEHQIQLTMMIALMKNKKVQTKDGKSISLWDAYKLDTQSGLYSLSSDVIWTKEETSNFRKEMHSILRELNGNYSELHKAVLQRSWWGKLMLVYRKYIYSQVRSRFGGFRMDYERGDVSYGYFRLFTKQLIQDIRDVGVGQAAKNIMYNLKDNENKTYLNYATRKTVFELATLTGLLLTIMALAPGDDEEETSKLNAYVLWWLNSLYSDLGSYSYQSLAEIGRQVKNPSAGNITLTKLTSFADQLLSDITSGDLERYEQDGYGYEKGDTRLGAKFEKLIPIVNQVKRAMNPEQQLQFFELIGKRVRTN